MSRAEPLVGILVGSESDRERMQDAVDELPPTLRQFSRRVRTGLTRLEREIVNARTVARGEATRLLREASQALGRYEAYGERQWRRLTTPARREALHILRRLEKALAPRPAAKRASPRTVAKPARSPRPAETAVPERGSEPPLPSGM